jgi:hypothetical protein
MEGSGSVVHTNNDGSGWPKTCGSYGSESTALLYRTSTDRCGFETVPKDSYTSTILIFFCLLMEGSGSV